MSLEPILTLENLSVGYGRKTVLTGLSLPLRAGSFTGLLGANGSGKSTLLKTILGIIPPLSGRLQFANLNDRSPSLGYVPQRESLDAVFLLSAFEVALMGTCGRVSPGRRIGKDEREFVRQCLRQTGAEDLARKSFAELSGGQKQRVLIARALATRPDLLLLDEPTAGLDLNAVQAIMDLLKTIHQSQNITILMVSHDLRVISRYAQEIIWLREGQVIHGPAERLLNRDKLEEILHLELD